MENELVEIKVNGFKIQQIIKDLSHEREVIKTRFVPSLKKFGWETKPSPYEISDKLLKLESDISSWQALQDAFNINVKVAPLGTTMSLAEAIKAIGGLSRVQALWQAASKEEENYFGESSRQKDTEYQFLTVSKEDAAAKAKEFSKLVAAFREAIQKGNAQELTFTVNKAILENAWIVVRVE